MAKKLSSILQSVKQSVNYGNYVFMSDQKHYIRDKDRKSYDYLFDLWRPYKKRDDAKYRLHLISFSNIAYRRVCKDVEHKTAAFKSEFYAAMQNYQTPENVNYSLDLDYLFPLITGVRDIELTIKLGFNYTEKLKTNLTGKQLAEVVQKRLDYVGKLMNTEGVYFKLWRSLMEEDGYATQFKRRIFELCEVKPIIKRFRRSLMSQIGSDRTIQERLKMRLKKKHGIEVNEDFAVPSIAELCEILNAATGYKKRTIVFKNARYYALEMTNFMDNFDGDFEEIEHFVYAL